MEAVWETEAGAPFTLFAWPDETTRSNRFAIEIPRLASLILTHDSDGVVRGLNEFEGRHPPVAPVFWAFRIMLAVGMLMLLVAWWLGWSVLVRKQLPTLLQLRVCAWMTFSGWVAVLAGWYVTEIGRQPWMVYEALLVADTVAGHGSGMMLSTLLLWLLLYAFVLFYYITTMRLLARKPLAALLASIQRYPDAPQNKERP
jgi:cytochrome d ubiquinol oxidase subunit I